MILELQKSLDLPFARWRTRKTRLARGPRTRSAHVWGQEKMDRRWAAQAETALPPPLVLFRPHTDGLMCPHPHWGQWSSLRVLPVPALISFKNTLTGTSRNNISPAVWASLSADKLTHKINHHMYVFTKWILESNSKMTKSIFTESSFFLKLTS